ncbi:hypothetical protein D3C77_714010 [compost metagenome]
MEKCVAGGGPAAAHFLCFAKESKQRKATATVVALGVNNSLPLQGAYPLASGYRYAGAEQCSANSLLHLKHVCAVEPV